MGFWVNTCPKACSSEGIPFLDMLPSSRLAPAEESSRSLLRSSSVSSSSPRWPRRFQWDPGFLQDWVSEWVSEWEVHLSLHRQKDKIFMTRCQKVETKQLFMPTCQSCHSNNTKQILKRLLNTTIIERLKK